VEASVTRSTRNHVIGIAAVSALLVFGGADPDASHRTTTPEDPAFDAGRIASILASVNPALSAEERGRIGHAVITSSRRHALDPELVTAVLLVESSARPWARSDKGAVGLMQVMPHMVPPRVLAGNLTTIESNVEAGCSILADNIRRLGEEDGISAYFWGSKIRGVAYLDRVQEARARVRRFSES
jgi:soluble lytic murein transglycosylase-like protein